MDTAARSNALPCAGGQCLSMAAMSLFPFSLSIMAEALFYDAGSVLLFAEPLQTFAELLQIAPDPIFIDSSIDSNEDSVSLNSEQNSNVRRTMRSLRDRRRGCRFAS